MAAELFSSKYGLPKNDVKTYWMPLKFGWIFTRNAFVWTCVLAALVGFESNNKYEIKNSIGQNVFYAVEENDCLTRQCCGPLRSFTIRILDNFGQEVITVSRPLKCMSCFFPCCLQEVSAPREPQLTKVLYGWSKRCKPNRIQIGSLSLPQTGLKASFTKRFLRSFLSSIIQCRFYMDRKAVPELRTCNRENPVPFSFKRGPSSRRWIQKMDLAVVWRI